MKERPILFSAPMVRAILAGGKTQTRRVVADSTSQGNVRPSRCDLSRAFADGGPSPAGNAGPYLHAPVVRPEDHGCVERIYPRYFPGDRLWVREKFCAGRAATESGFGLIPWIGPLSGRDYNATQKIAYAATGDYYIGGSPPWRPSIHMPRWASRITLEVTSVRVERVQSLTPDGAIAEGTAYWASHKNGPDYGAVWEGNTNGLPYLVHAYSRLWDSLNAKRGFGWDVNPWVWVIEFRRLAESMEAAA